MVSHHHVLEGQIHTSSSHRSPVLVWQIASTFRSSNPSESFQSTTFQFSLEKVCLALQKFHKAQTSHQLATDAPPTHIVRYKIKEWSTRRPTVDRLSTDCLPTRRPLCWPTRRWDRILNFYRSIRPFRHIYSGVWVHSVWAWCKI